MADEHRLTDPYLSQQRKCEFVSRNGKMTNSSIIKGVNWRQIVIHYVAIWLFSLAFEAFSYLLDTEFLSQLILAKQKHIKVKTLLEGQSGEKFTNIFYHSAIGYFSGLMLGLIISIIISIRRRWFWLNSLLALSVIFILGQLGIINSYFLRAVFLFPGIILQDISLTVIINASILLLLGCILFFTPKANEFIQIKKVEYL
jgi:hypothetical protein